MRRDEMRMIAMLGGMSGIAMASLIDEEGMKENTISQEPNDESGPMSRQVRRQMERLAKKGRNV